MLKLQSRVLLVLAVLILVAMPVTALAQGARMIKASTASSDEIKVDIVVREAPYKGAVGEAVFKVRFEADGAVDISSIENPLRTNIKSSWMMSAAVSSLTEIKAKSFAGKRAVVKIEFTTEKR